MTQNKNMFYRTQYIRIGFTFIAILFSIFFFIFWLHRTNLDKCKFFYDVYFDTPVSGLRKNDPVLYGGIVAGRVLDIFISRKNVEQIVVRVCLKPGFPIKEDAIAYLETKSIAGGSVISIRGGSQEAKILEPTIKGDLPIIKSGLSGFEKVVHSVPKVVDQIYDTLSDLFSEKQKKDLTQTLSNLKDVSAFFAQITKETKQDLKSILKLTKNNLEKFIALQTQLSQLTEKPGFHDFMTSGFSNLNKFLIQSSEAMLSIKKLTDSIERSPSRFIYNDPTSGVRMP